MTGMELEYLQRAVTALADPAVTDEDKAKILRTMSQICGICATKINDKIVDKMVDKLAV